MPRTYGYARVSSDEQKQSGLGMEAQHDAILAFVDYRAKSQPLPEWGGFTDDEAVSGAKPFLNRPGGKELHAKLCSGDHLVFHKLDRGFRDIADTIIMMRLWSDMSVNVHILNLGGGQGIDMATPFGAFMLHIMAAFAELERGLIAERMRAAVARVKARGGSMDRMAPRGFKLKNGTYYVASRGAVEEVRGIAARLARGATVASVVRELGQETHGGEAWSRWKVARLYRAYQRHRGLYEAYEQGRVGPDPDADRQTGRNGAQVVQLDECPSVV